MNTNDNAARHSASAPSRFNPLATTRTAVSTSKKDVPGESDFAIRPSSEEAQRHLQDLQPVLTEIEQRGIPYGSSIVWPAGLDRRTIAEMPLETRTRNCLNQSRFLEGSGPLTVTRFLLIENFGRKSLRHLVAELERFLKSCVHDAAPAPQPNGPADQNTTSIDPSRHDLTEETADVSTAWERAAAVLRPLLAAAAEFNGPRTVADALNAELVELARKMTVTTELEAISVESLTTGARGPISVAVARLENALLGMSPAQHIVVEHRLLRESGSTLAEVGSLVGVTRERIRQLQVKLEPRIAQAMGPEMRLVAYVLREELDPIVEEQVFDRRMDTTLGASTGLAERLLRQAVIDEMGFKRQKGTYVDDQARSVIAQIRRRAPRLVDDAGLLDEPLLRAELPNEDWQRHWPLLLGHTGLHRLHGFLALRNSAKARAKSALLSIGRAATREEIAAVCGLSATQVSGAFSNIPSVIRATKDAWALTEWVDDEYEGIVAEIIQRIEEDGGSTTSKRLLTELPEKFDVSASSVYSYMQTPKFFIRDGRVSLANVSSLELRPLDDAIHDRDVDGAAYWTFAVESRFFEGYSVTGVPPEFAKALGCEPDGGTYARIENLPNCRDLSVRWRVATTTGASMGYVADAIRELGLQTGQWVRVTLKGPNLVKLAEHHEQERTAAPRRADAILDRMRNRRRVL